MAPLLLVTEYLSPIKAPFGFGVSTSLTSISSLLLVAGVNFPCNGAHPLGYRARMTSERVLLTRYRAYAARDYLLQLKVAPLGKRRPMPIS